MFSTALENANNCGASLCKMLIGIPKEIKESEGRVAMTPQGVYELTRRHHTVLVEAGAGRGSGISDEEFCKAGAVTSKQSTIFDEAEMIVKVKEPLADEVDSLHEGQILLSFLHLASDKELAERVLRRKIIGIAYETVEDDGDLPLLSPMSAIAGRLAVQIGACCLETVFGGKGILLGGVPGVLSAEVVILGAGTVALNAARIAVGMGARVTVVGVVTEDMPKLKHLDDIFKGSVRTVMWDTGEIPVILEGADLLIGAVLRKGAKTPLLVTREMVKRMKPGSVIVDVSVDQGGCTETTRPTTPAHPTYVAENVVHCCITNLPGTVPRTSTFALANATLPYILEIADKGLTKAISSCPALAKGVNVFRGRLTYLPLSESLDIPYVPLEEALSDEQEGGFAA